MTHDDDVKYYVQGALYVVLGQNKRSLVTKRNWDVITRLWPALVQAQLHCEKPSVQKLFDDVIDKLHNDIETTEIELVVSNCFMRCFVRPSRSSWLPQRSNML